MAIRGAVSGAILKHDMDRQNKDHNRWCSLVRAPFESIFSKCEKRARYRRHAKFQFQFFMDAIAHNVNCLLSINVPPLFHSA